MSTCIRAPKWIRWHGAAKAILSTVNIRFRGFVFVETDRKSHLDSEAGWEGPLKELDWIDRIAQGRPRPSEDHSPDHAALCYAVVLWAPVPLGAQAMSKYYDKVKHQADNLCHLVKGFRYLVQEKPSGTMLTDDFVDALRWMGQNGFAFDLGVDVRSGGLWQLGEAYEMIRRAHDGVSEDKQVRIIINHMCKPDMRPKGHYGHDPSKPEVLELDNWQSGMARLASFSNTYVKISGGFSEILPLPSHQQQKAMDFWSRAQLIQKAGDWIERWMVKVLLLFGPERIMFGSDWPICNIGGGGNEIAWMNWWWIVERFAKSYLSEESQVGFWSGNAMRVYGKKAFS
ncbi:MAG: hypothetical protein Q9167_000212 [Letrouitia subvulpina]